MQINRKWYTVEERRTDNGMSVLHIKIRRNWAAWVATWKAACSVADIPFYRYPQALYQVTKCWWNIV